MGGRGEERKGEGALIDAMVDSRNRSRRRCGGICTMREYDRTYGLCGYSDFPGLQRSCNGGMVKAEESWRRPGTSSKVQGRWVDNLNMVPRPLFKFMASEWRLGRLTGLSTPKSPKCRSQIHSFHSHDYKHDTLTQLSSWISIQSCQSWAADSPPKPVRTNREGGIPPVHLCPAHSPIDMGRVGHADKGK